jgi:hypothetical protein
LQISVSSRVSSDVTADAKVLAQTGDGAHGQIHHIAFGRKRSELLLHIHKGLRLGGQNRRRWLRLSGGNGRLNMARAVSYNYRLVSMV